MPSSRRSPAESRARRKHRRALGVDVRQIEVVDMAGARSPAAASLRRLASVMRGGRIRAPQHVADHPHRARTAEGLQPAELAVGLLDAVRAPAARRCAPARSASRRSGRRRKSAGSSPTQPTDRLSSSSGLKPSPMTISVRAAADVDHQALVRAHRAGVRDARIDQARLLQTGDDLDRDVRAPRARARGTSACASRGAARWCPPRARCRRAWRAAAGRSARGSAARASVAASSSRPLSLRPAARRTISRSRSRMTSCPCE